MTELEIYELKCEWMDDPHWDLEETEGFEDHYEELLAFRKQCEAFWAQAAQVGVFTKMRELNCSYETAEYVIDLEQRLISFAQRVEHRLARLEDEL